MRTRVNIVMIMLTTLMKIRNNNLKSNCLRFIKQTKSRGNFICYFAAELLKFFKEVKLHDVEHSQKI